MSLVMILQLINQRSSRKETFNIKQSHRAALFGPRRDEIKILPLHIRNSNPQLLEIHQDYFIPRKSLTEVSNYEISVTQRPDIEHTCPVPEIRNVVAGENLPRSVPARKLILDWG